MTKSNLEQRIKSPIFVIACCNSGTTMLWSWLKRLQLVSGPDVEGQDLDGMPHPMQHFLGLHTFRIWAHYLHEQPHSRHGEDELPGAKLPYYFTEKDWTAEYQQQIEEVYLQYTKPGTIFCDKSPAHTLRARFLQACFPDARFIGIVRNGFAVAEGIRRKRKYDPRRPEFMGLDTRICDAAIQWELSNEVLVSYQQFGLLDNLHIVKYEDLVKKPNKTFQGILDFCKLEEKPFQISKSMPRGQQDPEVYDYTYHYPNITTLPPLISDLNKHQISGLRNYEIKEIHNEARQMLKHFGYVAQ